MVFICRYKVLNVFKKYIFSKSFFLYKRYWYGYYYCKINIVCVINNKRYCIFFSINEKKKCDSLRNKTVINLDLFKIKIILLKRFFFITRDIIFNYYSTTEFVSINLEVVKGAN